MLRGARDRSPTGIREGPCDHLRFAALRPGPAPPMRRPPPAVRRRPRSRAGWGTIGLMTASSGIGPARTPGLTRADVAMIVTRGQAWRDALHRSLAQLGLDWLDADSLMEDYSVGGMDLDLYWRAQRVIGEHRDMQETLFHADRIADGTSRRTLTEAAAERAAAGPGRVDADPCTDGGRGDHPALGPVRYAPGRRDVHFALESAVPTVILECKMHISAKKRTGRGRRGPRRRPRPHRPAPARTIMTIRAHGPPFPVRKAHRNHPRGAEDGDMRIPRGGRSRTIPADRVTGPRPARH